MKEPLTDIFWLVAKEEHFLPRHTLLKTHTEPEVLRDMPSSPQSKQRKKNKENWVLRRTWPFLSWVWTSD